MRISFGNPVPASAAFGLLCRGYRKKEGDPMVLRIRILQHNYYYVADEGIRVLSQ